MARNSPGKGLAMGVLLVFWVSLADTGRGESAEYTSGERVATIPTANPLEGFDASTVAWNGATDLIGAFTDWTARKARLDRSLWGRAAYVGVSWYLVEGANYYSHEIAHRFHATRRFRYSLNVRDWSHGYPALEARPCGEWWLREDLRDYLRRIVVGESGFYQEKCNARAVARSSVRERGTTAFEAVSFYTAHTADLRYLLFYRNEPVVVIEDEQGIGWLHDNDVTRYTGLMPRLGIAISSDDWLLASFLACATSGSMWNSARALWRYVAHGERRVENVTWRLSDRWAVSPPDFYLFPTTRGLYLESETCFYVGSSGEDRVHVVLGTGLDSFGLDRTGPVDWIRAGAMLDGMELDVRYLELVVTPYAYVDSSTELRYRGHSIGAEVSCPVWKRIVFTGKVEHNRSDMVENVVKWKEEGLYALATVGVVLR